MIIHPSPGWLAAAHPFLPGARLAAAPAGRRYLAGWAMASELHILNDEYTDRRAAGEDSLAALRGTAERLYAQIVLAANNERLPPPWGPRRFARYVRWAWLIEGGAQYFAGQTSLFRAAVNTRMRQGRRPPSRRRPATRSSSAARSTTCSRASAAATPAWCWSRGCGARAPPAPSSSPSTRGFAEVELSGNAARGGRAQRPAPQSRLRRPDFLAAGPRDILVPQAAHDAARELLANLRGPASTPCPRTRRRRRRPRTRCGCCSGCSRHSPWRCW